MYRLVLYALALVHCSFSVDASISIPIVCDQSTLYGVTNTDWHVSCDEAPTTKQYAFNPIHLQSFLLDSNENLRVIPNPVTPTQIRLSPSFDRIDALVSSTLKTFSLQTTTQWIPTKPVTILPTAFANLIALENLMLQDVPLADPTLHLVLPATLKMLVITGCRLERLTIDFVDAIGNQVNPTQLTQVALYSNQLVEIPLSLYAPSITTTLTSLDVRSNAFQFLTVSVEKEDVLGQWIVSGILQLNPTATFITCPSNSTLKSIQGISQRVNICVKTPKMMNGTTSPTISHAEDSTIVVPDTTLRSSKAVATPITETPTTKSQIELQPLPQPPVQAQRPDRQRQSDNTPRSGDYGSDRSNNEQAQHTSKHPAALMITLISVGIVSTVLAVVGLTVVVRRQRASHSTLMKSDDSLHGYLEPDCASSPLSGMKDLDPPRPIRSLTLTRISSAALMAAPAEDDLAYLSTNQRSSCVSSTRSSEAMFTSLSEFPDHQDDQIYTPVMMSTPSVPQHTSRTIPTHQSPQAPVMRQHNKQLLFAYLTKLCSAHCPTSSDTCITVNRDAYQCFGVVEETETGAFVVQCKPHPDHRSTVQPNVDFHDSTPASSSSLDALHLKVYVEQDAAIAIQEYRAMLVMQGNSSHPYIAQLVATEMDKQLVMEGTGIRLQCAVLVVERGSPTTLRNIVRHQIDRSQQFAIVQQLYQVVRAIECLHTRQFVHGAVGLEAFCVFPNDQDALKFHSLEWATRFGDALTEPTIYRLSTLEYTAPEFAQYALCHGPPNQEKSDPSLNRAFLATGALDVWALGILIIKVYASSKQLDEFQGCEPIHPTDFYLRIADPRFSLEQSLKLYVHHEEVRDLARQCLKRDPRRRPSISMILNHRVFRAYDRLEQQVSFRAPPHSAQVGSDESMEQELIPPCVWLFLPPTALSLDQSRTIDEWVEALTEHQIYQQRCGKQQYYSTELHFPLVFLCENSQDLITTCTTGLYSTRLLIPASLLSLVIPIIQQSTLFLETKAILSSTHTIAELSGLGTIRWTELMKFYRALEVLFVPMSSYSLSMLQPLQEKLATNKQEMASQVLEELKVLMFSDEQREHVRSVFNIIKTSPMAALESEDVPNEEQELRHSRKKWSGLRNCAIYSKEGDNNECSTTRWLCPCHLNSLNVSV